MGGCLVRSKDRTVGIAMAMKKVIAGIVVGEKPPIDVEEEDGSERTMLLCEEAAELEARTFKFNFIPRTIV